MELIELTTDPASLTRVIEELWVPYHRELERLVEDHGLKGDVDIVDAEVAFRRDWLETDGHHGWVAVEGADDAVGTGDLSRVELDLVGFVTTQVDVAPPVFTRPDRLVIGDIYVIPRARGGAVADALVDRAVAMAHSEGVDELALDVDADNDRARAFYRRLGFSPARHRLVAPVDSVAASIRSDGE